MGDYLESMLPKYRDLMESPRAAVIDTRVLTHQIPGGMASNLVSQLREADALDRLNEVLEEIPRTRKELGYPPLVTPMSQMIGSQSVSNVLFGRYQMVSGQVKDYFLGLYGRPPSPVAPEIESIVLKDTDQASGPAPEGSPAPSEPEMDLAREAIKDISTDIEDVLTYALYPTTGMRFLRIKHGLDPVPDDMKPRTLEQVEKDRAARAEAAKPAQTKPVDIPPKSSRARVFNVYLGDEFFRVEVDPVRSTGGAAIRVEAAPVEVVPVAAVRDEPAEPAQSAEAGETSITAPMPGIILRYVVEVGQKVQAGDPVVVLEAMKMENTLPSSITGEVKALQLEAGTMVVKDHVLAVIVP
jgi:pyruvate carboxylase subunit B